MSLDLTTSGDSDYEEFASANSFHSIQDDWNSYKSAEKLGVRNYTEIPASNAHRILHERDWISNKSIEHFLGADDRVPHNKILARIEKMPTAVSFNKVALAQIVLSLNSILSDKVDNVLLFEGEEFYPTENLLNYWISGMKYYSELARTKADTYILNSLTSLDVTNLGKEFSKTLNETIIMISRLSRQPESRSIEFIGLENNFSREFEVEFSNLFMIAPKDISQFLTDLSSEYLSFCKSGGRLSGNWGKTKYVSGRVLVELTAEQSASEYVNKAKPIDIEV